MPIFQTTFSKRCGWSAQRVYWLDPLIAPATRLNVLKDYLPQLLANEKTKPVSHYKRLIRFFRQEEPNQLVVGILNFVFRLLKGRFTYLIMDATTAPAARLASG